MTDRNSGLQVQECQCGHRLARHTYFASATPCTRCGCTDYQAPSVVGTVVATELNSTAVGRLQKQSLIERRPRSRPAQLSSRTRIVTVLD